MTENQVNSSPRLFSGARKEWKFVFKFVILSVIFWVIEFAYQFYVLVPGEFGGSLVRSFALAGATFIGLALFSSSIFKWKPKYAKYWYVRRSLGVMGFVFIVLHVLSVTNFLFQWNVAGFFWSLNPFENPIIFGGAGLIILFLMAITSTDVVVSRMGYPKWKTLHRLVYFGYLFAVFHFLLINPVLLFNPAGYLLLVITFLALAGMLVWFVQTVRKKKSSGKGVSIGIFVIFLALIFVYIAYFTPAVMEESSTLEKDIEKMKQFMENVYIPVQDIVTPEEKNLEPDEVLKSGSFQNINYMTIGAVSLIEKDGEKLIMFGDDFSAPNGPDLVAYLTKNTAPSNRKDVANGVVLGELRSIEGKQVYEIPSGINTDEYKSVTIHCRAFNVPWSYAVMN